MTREEEIKQAAEAYASQMCNLCLDKYCLKMGLTCPNIHESVIAFTDGSEWADEHPNLASLWHDVSERPKGNSEILVQWNIKEHTGCGTFHTPSCVNWMNFLEKYGVSRWAYIDDLLPKKFGNSEQLKGVEK